MSTHDKISPESPKKTQDKSTHPRGRLSISPVEICVRSNLLIKKLACVPFPAPGAPNKIIFKSILLTFFS